MYCQRCGKNYIIRKNQDYNYCPECLVEFSRNRCNFERQSHNYNFITLDNNKCTYCEHKFKCYTQADFSPSQQ
jgi:DNA-directed RNA polymerase subunit RPC12/RpoP